MDTLTLAKVKLEELKEKNSISPEDYDVLKKSIYLAQLDRYIQSILILFKAEERLLKEVDTVDIKEVVSIHKAVIKSMDNITSALRQFEPSLKEETDLESIVDKFNISPNDNPAIILQKVISSQVVSLLQITHEIQENLRKYKIGSLDHWKSSEALKGISALVLDLAKTIAKLQGEEGQEADLTMEEILEKYKQYVSEQQ